MKQKKKGFTVVEVVIAVMLLILLLGIVIRFYDMSNIAFKGVEDEFSMQTDFRATMQFISYNISNSSGIFLLKKDEFQPNKLKDGWGYIGVEEVTNAQGKKVTEIVKYEPLSSGPSKRIVIATSSKEITYELIFKVVDPESSVKIIEVTVAGYKNDVDGKKIPNKPPIEEIKTTYEASNSLNVSDWGYETNQSVAIAYKTSDRKISKGYANVFMVFDISGSMSLSLGNSNRITAAKSAAKALVQKIAYDNVEIGSALFDDASISDDYSSITNRNDRYYRRQRKEFLKFSNAKDEKSTIINFIDSITDNGMTNTGDGIRVAYHSFKDQVARDNSNGRSPAMNHFILLVDGDSNFYTKLDASATDTNYINSTISGYSHVKYYIGPKQSTAGNESFGMAAWYMKTIDIKLDPILDYDYALGAEYAKIMSQIIVRNDFVKPYLVECGNGATAEGMKNLIEGLGISSNDKNSYFKALDPDSLIASFQSIADSINKYLWFVDGPVQ